MNAIHGMAALAMALMASGCALQAGEKPSAGRTITIAGQVYQVAPLTAGTWTVSTPGSRRPLPKDTVSAAAMRGAVEAASGCRVTDSNYSPDGLQLDAQIDCAGLKS